MFEVDLFVAKHNLMVRLRVLHEVALNIIYIKSGLFSHHTSPGKLCFIWAGAISLHCLLMNQGTPLWPRDTHAGFYWQWLGIDQRMPLIKWRRCTLTVHPKTPLLFPAVKTIRVDVLVTLSSGCSYWSGEIQLTFGVQPSISNHFDQVFEL